MRSIVSKLTLSRRHEDRTTCSPGRVAKSSSNDKVARARSQLHYSVARDGELSLKKIAVLASGGLDSAVLLAELASAAHVYPIYVKCGLKWEAEELRALNSFLDALKNPQVMPLTALEIPTAALYGDHW